MSEEGPLYLGFDLSTQQLKGAPPLVPVAPVLTLTLTFPPAMPITSLPPTCTAHTAQQPS